MIEEREEGREEKKRGEERERERNSYTFSTPLLRVTTTLPDVKFVGLCPQFYLEFSEIVSPENVIDKLSLVSAGGTEGEREREREGERGGGERERERETFSLGEEEN